MFGLSTALVLYVLFGYPILLSLLARRAKRPVQKRFAERTVSILLPVRNGQRWISRKLRSLAALDYPQQHIEVIVVCDGCEDKTAELARSFPAGNISVVTIPASGKAVALNEGMKHATGEILFLTDVRQQVAPDCLRNLVSCFADPSVGAVTGELVLSPGRTPAEADAGLYWRYEKWIRRNLSRIDSLLGATGAVYAIRTALARPLRPGTLLDDVELPLGAFFAGYRIVHEESAVAYDDPAPLGTEFIRKVRTLAGNYQTLMAHPGLLGFRNRMWIHFVSHKVGRLVLPWAILAISVSSFLLPHGWREAALLPQAAALALALLDSRIPRSWKIKRLSSPVRTFAVLMLASACAVWIVFRPDFAFWSKPTASETADEGLS